MVTGAEYCIMFSALYPMLTFFMRNPVGTSLGALNIHGVYGKDQVPQIANSRGHIDADTPSDVRSALLEGQRR
jgi:hypothetical protein